MARLAGWAGANALASVVAAKPCGYSVHGWRAGIWSLGRLRFLQASLFDRYLFKQIALTTSGMLLAMTAVIVCVVALQELDVITNRGAALISFVMLTALSIPQLLSILAPIALFLALLIVFNRLSSEREIVVVSASGGSPVHLLRAVMTAALIVSFLVALVGHAIAPPAQRAWRYLISEVRADLLASVVKEGSFSSIQEGVTFHMRAREPGGVLADIMIADTREFPAETIYFAQRGTIVRGEQGSFLAVEDGVIQRRSQADSGRVSTAHLFFDAYSIDLSFADQSSGPDFFKPSEQSTLYLLNPDPNDPFMLTQRERFAAEIHNRMALPLYPLGFAMIVVLALGTPHSGRAGRATRVLLAILGAAALLGAQYGAAAIVAALSFTWPLLYIIPIGVMIVGYRALSGHAVLPKAVARLLAGSKVPSRIVPKAFIRAPQQAGE